MNNIINLTQIRKNNLSVRIDSLMNKPGIRPSHIVVLARAKQKLQKGEMLEAESIIKSIEKKKDILNGLSQSELLDYAFSNGINSHLINSIIEK